MSFFQRFRGALVLVPMLALPLGVWAATIDANSTGLKAAGTAAGLGSICSGNASQCIATLVGRVLNVSLSFVGILLLIYVLYAGFLWMSAGGDDKQVKTAKDTIMNAVIGMVLLVSAFAISSFVLTQLGGVVGDPNSGSDGGSDTGSPQSSDTPPPPSGTNACNCQCSGGGAPLVNNAALSCTDETFCSEAICTSRCRAGELMYVSHTCAVAPTSAPSGPPPTVPQVCNCECNIQTAVNNIPASIVGACSVGSCQTACANACTPLHGVGTGVCGAAARTDNRTQRQRCEATTGIGNPTYYPPRPQGQLEAYRNQCEYCMRSNLIDRCIASIGTDSDLTIPGSPSVPAVQGQVTQVCGSVCNAR